MTTTSRETKKEPAAHALTGAFPATMMVEDMAKRLRERFAGQPLTISESKQLLLAGNEAHVKRLVEFGISPQDRYTRIITGTADYLVVACSDSRLLKLDSEDDTLVGIQVRVAGNVIPKSGTASCNEIRDTVKQVKPAGLIIIEGHINCGAVSTHNSWEDERKPDTGNSALNQLLETVAGRTPQENAANQARKARETLDVGTREVDAVVYDWAHGLFDIVSGNPTSELTLLVDSWRTRHVGAESHEEQEGSGQPFATRLKTQKPHCLVVGAQDLPYSAMTVLRAHQGEVFSTTGSEDGLDAMDEASILYAVEHLHVKHIPFIAPGNRKDEPKLRVMFDLWEQNIRDVRVKGQGMLSNMLDSGELAITRYRYDLHSGRLVEMI